MWHTSELDGMSVPLVDETEVAASDCEEVEEVAALELLGVS